MNHDICYLFVYVDDILLTDNNFALIQRLITLLSLEFKFCDLSNAHYFLGVKVTPTSMGLILSQHKYVLDIFFVVLVCHCVNLLIHRPLFPKLTCSLVSYFQIPLAFTKLLVLFSISPLLDRTYAMV
jgi:hypothetical protein